jgi:hypothetical protein
MKANTSPSYTSLQLFGFGAFINLAIGTKATGPDDPEHSRGRHGLPEEN